MDLIDRAAAIDALAKVARDNFNLSDEFEFYLKGLSDAEGAIYELPSAQSTLYGYKIEHLAYIARVMEKEGVTAEYAVRTFDDMSRVIKMIIDEIQQKVEEALK